MTSGLREPGTPKADPLEAILRRSPLTNAQRADVWDAYESSDNEDELATRLEALKIPKQVKASLWDLKAESGGAIEEHQKSATANVIEPQGGAIGRFAAGVAKHVNPVEIAKGIGHAVMHPLDTLDAAREASADQYTKTHRVVADEMKVQHAAVRAGEQTPAAGAVNIFTRAMPEAVGHFVAGTVPFIGPAAATAGEKIASGDIAGGMGEGVGQLASMLVPAAVRGGARALKASGAAEKLEAAGAAKVADVMSPKVGPNKTRFANKADDVAPKLVRDLADDGAPLTKGGFHQALKARLAEAEAMLDDASNARLPTKTFPTKEILADLQKAREALTAKAVGKGKDVVPGPNSARVAMINQAINEVKAVRGPMVGYETIRRIRQAYDGPAKAVYHPSLTQDFLKAKGNALGAADVTGVLRNHLAKWDPQTAAANAKYSLYRNADDVMSAAAEVERARPKVGRQIMARLTGGLVGGAQGGTAGAIAGMVGAPLIDSALASGLTTQLKTAATLQRLADAIRKGDVGRVQSITHGLRRIGVSAAPTASRLPPSGRPAHPRAADQEDEEPPRDRVALR